MLALRLSVAAIAGTIAFAPLGSGESPTEPAGARTALSCGGGTVPFGVGERLEYKLTGKVARMPLPLSGTGVMEIPSIDNIRGRSAYRIRFEVRGGVIGFRVNDLFESWLDSRTLTSLRYIEDKHEGGYKKKRTFEIYPELRQFRQDSNPPEPSVECPLDDGSFVYFIRTIPLEVGKTYEFHHYFRPDRNPVTVHVDRKERIRVAGKEWDALVIRPTILTSDKGLFSKDSRAEIWLAADSSRIVLRMESHFMLGVSLNLALTSYQPAPAPARRPSGR